MGEGNGSDLALAKAFMFCQELVRNNAYERWLASLYWPTHARPFAHALLAFDLEMAKIPGAVSQPALGEIRYQWWRDALSNYAGAGNPVAIAFLHTLRRFDLDRGPILRSIESRSFDLYDDPMPSEAALENYLRDTSALTFGMLARVLAPGHLPPASVDAAGRAYGLIDLLRQLPKQVAKGQLYAPLDLLERLKVSPETILARRNSPGLGLVLQTLRARVRVHLREMLQSLRKNGFGQHPGQVACLPAFLCEPYLRRMEQPALNPLKTAVDLSPWRVQWTLWRASRQF